jgi:hypothetical protein
MVTRLVKSLLKSRRFYLYLNNLFVCWRLSQYFKLQDIALTETRVLVAKARRRFTYSTPEMSKILEYRVPSYSERNHNLFRRQIYSEDYYFSKAYSYRFKALRA